MNWKKVVSVLLVSAMTLSMAACGDTAGTSDNAAGTEAKGAQTQQMHPAMKISCMDIIKRLDRLW